MFSKAYVKIEELIIIIIIIIIHFFNTNYSNCISLKFSMFKFIGYL